MFSYEGPSDSQETVSADKAAFAREAGVDVRAVLDAALDTAFDLACRERARSTSARRRTGSRD